MPFTWISSLWSRWFMPPDAGRQGERLAAAFLQRRCGHVILVRNWRNPSDEREEIDLVTRDGEVLVFVEVKARSSGALVPGYYAVTARKKRVLRRACIAYLKRLRQRPRTFRFDVVEVELPRTGRNERPQVRHFANVRLFGAHFR